MTPQERKERSEKIISSKGLTVNKFLPCIEGSDSVKLRSLDEICRRAIAALISVQICFEREEGSQENIDFFKSMLENFGVSGCLNKKEQRVADGSCDKQDLVDVVWEYECYWALVWALGLVEDITDASNICDCEKAVKLVSETNSFEEFRAKCSLRGVEEILDMLDLYYRYHWAAVENRLDPKCEIGKLSGDVAVERRRGLEWLVLREDEDEYENENDWYDISLDT